MSQNPVQSLLQKASEFYNQGQYEKAIETWNEVLRADPGNQKAAEGIRMANLLSTHDQGAAAEQQADSDDFRDRVEAIKGRVRELVTAGNFEDAMDGCRLLEDLAPDDPGVGQLREEVRNAARREPVAPPLRSPDPHAARAGSDAETELIAARRALERGDEAVASRAAKAVLAQDPGNMEAVGILSMTGGTPAAGLPADGIEPIAVDDLMDTAHAPVAAIDPHAPPEIRELLEVGQAHFEVGRMQDAIDTWSRIYAIDADYQLAGELIDRARRSLESGNQQIERLFQQAVDARDAGRLDEARELFHRVRSMSPMHAEALIAIEEIDAKLAGEAVSIGLDSQSMQDAAREREAARSAHSDHTDTAPGKRRTQGVLETEGIPLAVEKPREFASRPQRHTPAPDKPVALPSSPRSRVMLAFVGAVVVLGAGLWAWTSFGTDQGISDAAATPTPDKALRPAQRPPAGGATAAPVEEALSPEQLKGKAKQLELSGYEHYKRGEWAAAVQDLREARRINPLFSMQDTLDVALRNLENQAEYESEMESAVKYFAEGDYASSLHKFYRLQQKFADRAPFDKYIIAAWFNWGALLMEAGAVDEALEKFNEVLAINPYDADAKRAREVATRYQERPRDLAFDSFVQTLVRRRLEPAQR